MPGEDLIRDISRKKDPGYLLTKNNMYIDSISPELRSFEDEMEFEQRADTQRHYEGIAHEASTGQPHLCSLCEKHSPNTYDFRALTRKLAVIRYCTWFDSLTWDEDDGYTRYEDEARERRGDITELEISEYRASIKRPVDF